MPTVNALFALLDGGLCFFGRVGGYGFFDCCTLIKVYCSRCGGRGGRPTHRWGFGHFFANKETVLWSNFKYGTDPEISSLAFL